MEIETRLRDLCQRRERRQAEQLAKAVLDNEPVETVEVDRRAGAVVVETPHFTGTHDLLTNGRGAIAVSERGEYSPRSDDLDLAVEVRRDEVEDRAREAADRAREAATSSATATVVDPEPGTSTADVTTGSRPISDGGRVTGRTGSDD